MSKFNNKNIKLLYFLIFTLSIYLINSFEIWNQITYFYGLYVVDSNQLKVSEIYQFLEFYHYPRASIFYPLIVIANYFSMSLNNLFQLYTSFFLVLSICVQYLTAKCLYSKEDKLVDRFFFILIGPFYLLLAHYMNGRIVYAFFGISLLNYLMFKYKSLSPFKLSLLYFLSGLFCSVSSGIFLLYYIILITHLITIRKSNVSLIPYFFNAFVWLPYLLVGLHKNLEYFDFSLLMILSHGYGVNTGLLILSLVLFLILVVGGSLYYRKLPLKNIWQMKTLLFFHGFLGVILSILGRAILASQLPTFILMSLIGILSLKQTISTNNTTV